MRHSNYLLGALTLGLLACKPSAPPIDPEQVAVETAKGEPAIKWPDEAFRATRPTPKPIANVPIMLPIGAHFILCPVTGTFTVTTVEQSAG
jgi:hypothetical protein